MHMDMRYVPAIVAAGQEKVLVCKVKTPAIVWNALMLEKSDDSKCDFYKW